MTVNDLEANELLTAIARIQPLVSLHVRNGCLGAALTEASKMEDAARKLNWRLLELKDRKEQP